MTADSGNNAVRRAILWMARSALVWTLVALVDLAPNLLDGREAPELNPQLQRYLVTHASMWFGCWLFTPLVFYLARRFTFSAGTLRTAIAVHVLAALATAELNGVIAQGVLRATHLRSFSLPVFPIPGMLQYAAILTFATMLMLRERERDHELARGRLETQLSQARVQALTAQLRPHFLYNALNGVAMLIRARAYDAALESVLGYGELLRSALDADASDVPLQQELAFIDKYLAIERMRFPDTFSVVMTTDESLANALVPNLILQPLVENALHHGLRDLEAGARLEITASRQDNALRLEVRDNGVGFPPGWRIENATGVGLRNTQARLRQRYGDAHHFELHSPPEGGTAVIVDIPLPRPPAMPRHG